MSEPYLVDNLRTSLVLPDGRIVLAKPYLPTGLPGLLLRTHHAWLVLTGRATAILFDEDL